MILRSPVNRIGGKHFLSNWIVEKIPENHKIFVDVFAGSCVISLNKQPCEITIVNDLDSHLITFWKILQDAKKRERLITLLDSMLYSRVLWRELRERWKSGSIPGDTIERAGQWFFLNRSSYASDIRHGGYIGYTKGRNMCKTFRNAVEQLDEVGEIVKTWIIENLDYKSCIARFDSPATVFFVDAPYLQDRARQYYEHSFTLKDHKELADLLNNIRGKAMFCHHEYPEIDKLYAGWHKYTFRSFKGSSKTVSGIEKPSVLEVLYCNFTPPAKNRSLCDAMERPK